MEVTGTIHKIEELQTFNEFTKQNLIIKTNEQYPQFLNIEFHKDKTTLLNSKQVGETVTVGINLRGKEYNGKYYNSFIGWKIA